jgi:predicted RNase H-like HicB family nuclease
MRNYIAIVSKERGSIWGIHFPDLPGCTSAGKTVEEAIANAGVALRLWAEDEHDLPAPSTLESLRRLPDVREDLDGGGVAIYVPLIVAGRKERYNVMLDPVLVEGIDRAAKTAGVSRSDFIAQAAVSSLEHAVGAVVVPRRRTAQRKALKVRSPSSRKRTRPSGTTTSRP